MLSRLPGFPFMTIFGWGIPDDDQGELAHYELVTGARYNAEHKAPYLTKEYRGPYLLVNTAVNLSKTKKLAWQERKAAAFLISPGYSGFETSMEDDEHADGGSYRPTYLFASKPTPLSLGDAMAMSGAAANPSMGYHSRRAYAVLLALFNVRLGKWVGNPRVDTTWQKSSPVFALWYLLKEAFNSTSDEDGYLQLSDGGHFDNLGLYTLVKRRCRYIVCCDAGADGDFEFEDLGNAIRKCRIDLRADIEIDVNSIRGDNGTDTGRVACAVGKIFYRKENRVGTLVYIKPCKSFGLPTDVVNYALIHSSFPHQTTGDQSFSESQFESYRALGHFLAKRSLDVKGAGSISTLFKKLQQHWHSTSSAPAIIFSKYALTLDQLFDRLRQDKRLSLLDQQFYPGWRAVFSESPTRRSDALMIPVAEPEVFRACFYFCNSLIQLMEQVFIELDLQEQHGHPDNRGWINLFMHWSWSGMFRVTWSLSAATYGVRFQSFCQDVMELGLGELILVEMSRADWYATEKYHANSNEDEAGSPVKHRNNRQGEYLNFLEWEQVNHLLENAYQETTTIYQLLLVPIIGTKTGKEIKLPVGYAIIEGHRLRMYRVQNHLRKMGLGRAGIRELLDIDQSLMLGDKGKLGKDLVEIGEIRSQAGSEEAVNKFSEMLDSVIHELASNRPM